MPGYLLDTNHVSAYFDRESAFIRRLESTLPEHLFFISAISLGEIEASYQTTKRDPAILKDFKRFVREEFMAKTEERSLVLSVDQSSRTFYADIVGRIMNGSTRDLSRERTEAYLARQGIDINDVWIVATAWNHNLTLLTSDKMKAIRQAAPEVRIENWRTAGAAVTAAIEPSPLSSQ